MITSRSRVRTVVLAMCVATSMSACAVKTPRDGLAVGSQPGVAGPQGSVTLPGGEVVAPGTSAVGDAVGAPGVGPGLELGGAAQLGGGGSSGAVGAPGAGAAATTGGTGESAGPAGSGTSQGPAGGGGAAPGVTPKTITIAVLAGFTGGYGPIIEGFYGGYETWRDDVNARGGIFGRQVVLKKVDHKDTSEGGVAACKQIQGDKDTFLAILLLGLNGSDTSAVNCLDSAGTPTLGISLSSYRDSWKHVHTLMDNHHPHESAPSFIKNRLRRGDTKIGLMVSRVSTTFAGKKPFEAEMKRLDMPIVHTEVVSEGQSNFVSEMTRMRNAGAETVHLMIGPGEAVGALRDARAIDYRPTFVGSQGFMLDEVSTAGHELMDGIEGLRIYSATNTKAYATFREKHEKHGGKVFTSTVAAVYGYGLFTEAVLRKAGQRPTQPGLTPAIESITNYNNGYQALSFGPGVKRSTTFSWPVKCCQSDGTWLGTGEPKARF